jgi:hypothetical protein
MDVFEDGTVHARALLSGTEQTAGAPVTVEPCDDEEGEPCDGSAQASLICAGAVRGAWVECEVSVDSSTATVSITRWTFTGNGLTVVDSTTTPTWSGTGVQSGLVTAEVVVNGEADTVSDSLKITPREWGFTVEGSAPIFRPGRTRGSR